MTGRCGKAAGIDHLDEYRHSSEPIQAAPRSLIDNVLTDLNRLGRLACATPPAARSWPKAAIAREMLEQSSLALVGEMPIAAASAKKASNLAIDLTLSPLPDGLEHAVQNAARRPGGSLWQICGIVADGEVMVPGNGVHGLNPFFQAVSIADRANLLSRDMKK